LPFGDKSFERDKIAYLTVEQALADYAVFLTKLKKDYNLTDDRNPIIAFGGSYGGLYYLMCSFFQNVIYHD
jgi:hypothetical protein